MFGFIGKFKQQVAQQMESAKNEVISGFDAVHQRLVTLEAQVNALFKHTQEVASAVEVKDVVGEVKQEAEKVAQEAEADTHAS